MLVIYRDCLCGIQSVGGTSCPEKPILWLPCQKLVTAATPLWREAKTHIHATRRQLQDKFKNTPPVSHCYNSKHYLIPSGANCRRQRTYHQEQQYDEHACALYALFSGVILIARGTHRGTSSQEKVDAGRPSVGIRMLSDAVSCPEGKDDGRL